MSKLLSGLTFGLGLGMFLGGLIGIKDGAKIADFKVDANSEVQEYNDQLRAYGLMSSVAEGYSDSTLGNLLPTENSKRTLNEIKKSLDKKLDDAYTPEVKAYYDEIALNHRISNAVVNISPYSILLGATAMSMGIYASVKDNELKRKAKKLEGKNE